ncbi:hypothetical protein Ocin01_06567 [Orchesella cincta]|uniref:Uncharacterized protein n=1 Tax=Orchesella cincta TaxID=48709 RepID=A0A1D2N4A0_ORCCI|nr:hypothetical protein Ocin01_06567 [Orchesella cincta]
MSHTFYKIWRVCATFVLLTLTLHVDSLPLINLSDSQLPTEGEKRPPQSFVELRESDKSLLRSVALFIGVLVVFSMIICLCATYWCMCWVLQCPGLGVVQSLTRVARHCNVGSRRRIRNEGKSSKGGSADLPPPYEVILACKPDEYNEDEDLPSYSEALCKEVWLL